MSARGTYAKGRAKRDQIVSAAYDLVRALGVKATTLREVAAASSTSTAGVLHHFASMDELFVEVLRRRDDLNTAGVVKDGSAAAPSIDGLIAVMHENSGEPGLVQLYTALAATSVDPAHAAHDYFQDRYRRVRAQIGLAYRRVDTTSHPPSAYDMSASEPAPAYTDGVDPDRVARLLAAAADGLQLQWLYQPDFDLGTELAYLLALIASNTRTGPDDVAVTPSDAR